MKRVRAIVLSSGAVLLSTRMLAPASSPAPAAPLMPADLAAIAQASPIVEQVDAQVDRLRERLASPPAYPPPSRDPFRFGQREEATRPKPAPPPAAVLTERPIAPALPHLVAIATNIVSGTPERSAVLALGDDLQIVKVGDTYAKFVVRSVGSDGVELTEPATASTFKISIQ